MSESQYVFGRPAVDGSFTNLWSGRYVGGGSTTPGSGGQLEKLVHLGTLERLVTHDRPEEMDYLRELVQLETPDLQVLLV